MAAGFNFRSSLAHVTDPVGTVAVIGGDAYQTIRDGESFGVSGGAFRDRAGATDARFAGTWYPSGATTVREFQYDLPAAGTYPVKIASGDVEFGTFTAGRIRVRDGVGGTVLLDVTLGTIAAGVFADSNGDTWTEAQWDANAAVDNLAFTGTKFVVEIGDSTATDTSDSKVAHIEVGDAIAGGTPTITNIDTDNAVNQYQQAIVNVSNFTETITSVTLGGVACTVPENDPTDNQIMVGVPGSLTTGTYDLVISGATETDTLTGVSYTQTHARPAFDGLVDSNSILSGQSYTANTYFRFVTSLSNGTLDTSAGDAAEWAGDIADYYTPNEGFTGDDTASIEFLYADGTTSATVGVTVSVVDGVVVSTRGRRGFLRPCSGGITRSIVEGIAS